MPLGLGSLSRNSVPITAKYRQKIIDILSGILRMNFEPPRIFAFSPRLGKPGWRRGRLSSPLTLRTAAEAADLAIFANIWTHSSLRSPLNA
jgi:hypothetical protein